MKKDLRYSYYPFMREESSLVDYEIRTDSLASKIGLALAILRENDCYKEIIEDLLIIQPLAYHANGYVRGILAITEENLDWLSQCYDKYAQYCGETI